ncbi:MAG: diguanylate cyclase [Lachnospiraceae bacterium]|nr:diguanylate cyclase [Lachnospiraceae bacterium]
MKDDKKNNKKKKNKIARVKDIKGSNSLYAGMLWVTLFPLVIYGIVIMIYISFTLTNDVAKEARNNLRNVSYTVKEAYGNMYEGDYNVVIYGDDIDFYKGSSDMTESYGMIDSIHEETGLDISIFFLDTRLLTTVRDSEGNRFLKTGINPAIVTDVVTNRKEMFYDNIVIGNENYYAYYTPLMSEDNDTALGMIGVAKPASEISRMAFIAVAKSALIIVAAMVITALLIIRFTSGIIATIKKIMKFTNEIADGDLSTELDPAVANRSDELGELGRLVTKLRGSLRRLIERDALTGIYNRRYAVNKLNEFKNDGIRYCVTIGDIDFFKKFNDSFGHECGDVVLKEVARVLREGMAPFGYATRWGGEEFLLIFENMDLDAAGLATQGVLDKIRALEVNHEGKIHSVTMSFGVAASDKERSMDEDVNAADMLLYEAKEGGRNRVVFRAEEEKEDISKEEAGDTEAGDTEAGNIDAGNIEAGNIEAGDTEAEKPEEA